MASPQEEILALDNTLDQDGQDVTLRRISGQGNSAVNIDVVVRAKVRTWRLKEEQVLAGIAQAVLLVVISPTQILKAQWPGGTTPGQSVDPSAPRRGDKVIIDGRLREIEAVETVRIANVVVRYNMQVLG